jgi:hypothetical protein
LNITFLAGSHIGLVCDLLAHRLLLFINGVEKASIEGIFGTLHPVLSLQASASGPAKVGLTDFGQSNFRNLNWSTRAKATDD